MKISKKNIAKGKSILARLEYLRGELRAERISYGEILELQSLKAHIEAGDVELLEAAGVPEFPTVKPHFETHANPLTANFESVGGETYFTHYEIQTVREWQAPDGSRAFEVCTDQDQCEDDAEGAAGPVLFGIYGHLNMGGVEHLCDRATLAEARETVARMGITI